MANTDSNRAVPSAPHAESGSPALQSGELAAIGAKFAEGYARVREVTDGDSACPAWTKALFMSAAAAVRKHEAMCNREMQRAVDHGLALDAASGAALAVLISRGEGVYETFRTAIDGAFLMARPSGDDPAQNFSVDRQAALDHFENYFETVPDYIELMADEAPRALEGYVLMRDWALSDNPIGAMWTELMFLTMNAAEFSTRTVSVHATGARKAGATEAQIVEAAVCAIPVSGLATWLQSADGIRDSRH